mmetsp:Transcript_82507/g.145618  ORF Transcript_82507/g.145618 Transcript_82507/m.145618 type:complete len:423 (-) Transcript_82507:64-1332(-)|eukprot:CAMPEP_0197658856 /NCGR_PEP_ID=MMETSP1338-20131121/45488_1 /TAXON_ID=43686 ORGANISM="Pelagodinium beii, Strain RCC1491" /NCGR_SAMPLE_ID=MMETSP1338 /ASSEMBLY_ACC=CAM_ASM_000754 /LENGTH=422 /DNA_ID=CAMNT_0043235529 /DNA_START=75 /DNA_END=1343 /DNA_ORIENTATION=+
MSELRTESVQEAIGAVQQAICHPGLSSEWTSILCATLRRPSETSEDIKKVLENNGWTTRGQFRSPPNREILLRDLQELLPAPAPAVPSGYKADTSTQPARSQREFPGRVDDVSRFQNQYVFEEKEKPVGEGTYGAVYRATCKKTGQTVAIKVVKMEHEDEGMPSTAIREVAVLKAADHPNVVKLLDVLCTPGRLNLVFEFVECNLKQHMKKFGLRLDPTQVRMLQCQLMQGIDFCHARRIIHRDLKPQNILVDGEDFLKIADFGMARAFNLPIPKYTHEVVTTWYRSPEILFGCEEYSTGVDVWSAGCILGELATGAPLFHGDSEIDTIFQIFRKMGTPTYAEWPGLRDLPDYKPTFPQWERRPWGEIRNTAAQLGQAGMQLLDEMVRYDPIHRISAKRSLVHEYFFAPLPDASPDASMGES